MFPEQKYQDQKDKREAEGGDKNPKQVYGVGIAQKSRMQFPPIDDRKRHQTKRTDIPYIFLKIQPIKRKPTDDQIRESKRKKHNKEIQKQNYQRVDVSSMS